MAKFKESMECLIKQSVDVGQVLAGGTCVVVAVIRLEMEAADAVPA